MNRREFTLGSAISIILAAPERLVAAEQRRLQTPSWTSALPATVTFESVISPTAEDLTRVARLVYVTRNTWGPDANVSGICFDSYTGGPQIVAIEQGTLRVVVNEPDSEWIPTLPATALPTAFLASKEYTPATVVPETWLELQQGDVIAFPNGSDCGKYGVDSTVFLEVTLLPGSPMPPTNVASLGMTGQVLDVSFGVTTINEPAPPIIVAGRLHIAAGSGLPLDDLVMPLALSLEAGDAIVNATQDSGLVRDAALADYEPNSPLPSGQDVVLASGQSIYIPATATGSVSSASGATFLMAGVDLTAHL